MITLAICAGYDTPPKHPSDATSVFIPGAQQWQKEHGGDVMRLDNRAQASVRFAQAVKFLRGAPRPLDALCYVGHGLKHGLPSAGVEMSGPAPNLTAFVDALVYNGAARNLRVMLMGCDAGRDQDADRLDDIATGLGGEGGMADALRDELVMRGLGECEVYAHAIDGHATRCPFLRVFRGVDAGRGGGDWIVEPHSPSWPRWKLRAGSLWPRLPWLTRAELERELA